MVRTDDRGETSAQFVVLAPVLFALVLAVVQVSSLWTAAQTASIAARRGARAASMAGDHRRYFVSAATAVEATVGELRGRLAAPPEVRLDGTNVTVEVSLGISSIVPFVPSSVTRSVTVPLERFVQESER